MWLGHSKQIEFVWQLRNKSTQLQPTEEDKKRMLNSFSPGSKCDVYSHFKLGKKSGVQRLIDV